MVEILEPRIAPAALLSFLDADGVAVSISSSKGTLQQLQAVLADNPVVDGKTTLLQLDFTDAALRAAFKGTNLTITAGTSLNDGITTKIGFINAAGLDLGTVVIDGDISRFDAGDGNSTTAAFKSLQVATWGLFDLTPESAEPGEFDSTVIGGIGALTVKGDFHGAFLEVKGSGSELSTTDIHGRIGSLTIGGSLIGTARENGGSIFATGAIGKILVTGAVQGFSDPTAPAAPVADQDHNGRIFSGKSIGAISVGSLRGGDGFESGQIASVLGMGRLTVTGDIEGGRGKDSGSVGSGGALGKVTIDGSVTGGSGERSGSILSSAVMQAVSIGGSLRGGVGAESGFIGADQGIRGLVIDGSVLGGAGEHSGVAGSDGPVGSVVIAGTVGGGSGDRSGQIVSLISLQGVRINGSLTGGAGFESGAIGTLGKIGPVLIGGDIVAGTGGRSGLISTEPLDETGGVGTAEGPSIRAASPAGGGSIHSITVLGSIRGIPEGSIGSEGSVSGQQAGSIRSGGRIGALDIRGDVLGGDADYSGGISSYGAIASVKIGGDLKGGAGYQTGAVGSFGRIGPMIIEGSIFAGSGTLSGVILTDYLPGGSGRIKTDVTSITVLGSISGKVPSQDGTEGGGSGGLRITGSIGKLVIQGDLLGGAHATTGRVRASEGIGTVIIGGSLIGGSGASSGTLAGGPEGIVGAERSEKGNIRSITIGHDVIGGSGPNSGTIRVLGDLGTVKITGALVGGTARVSGLVAVDGKIGAVEVSSITGGGLLSRPTISATDAIKSVTVADSIVGGDIIAGIYGTYTNPNAQIGTVKIGTTGAGNMTATNIVASARPGTDRYFGTSDDVPLPGEDGNPTTSKIASIIVKGAVLGTDGNRGDHFGIVARTVSSVRIGGEGIPLQKGPANDNLLVGPEGTDVSIRESGV